MNGNNTITAVLFDFGGVLAEEGFQQGLKAIARKQGLDEQSFFETAKKLVYSTGYVTGQVDEDHFWERLRQSTGISGSDREFREDILSRFVPRPFMFDLVTELKNKGLSVGILSDQVNWLEELDQKYDFFNLFDHVFNSYRMHTSKKDPDIFLRVLEVIGKSGRETLFIDDSKGNVDRARQVGLQALLYSERDILLRDIRSIGLV